jgi:hypothetical protein
MRYIERRAERASWRRGERALEPRASPLRAVAGPVSLGRLQGDPEQARNLRGGLRQHLGRAGVVQSALPGKHQYQQPMSIHKETVLY